MPTLRKSIAIRAPVDRVFDYVGDPTNLPEIWPSLVAVRNVESHPTGNSFDWDYKLLGLRSTATPIRWSGSRMRAW